MKRLILCGALALTASACKGGASSSTAAPALRNDDDRTLYALGLVMGQRLGDFNLNPSELEIVKRGLTDQVTGAHAQVDLQQFGPRISQMAQTRQTARAATERQHGEAFVAQAAREPGAVRLPSGLVYKDLQVGTGPQPQPSDRVRVNYRGTLTNGTEFDSSYRRNQPAEFALNGVIPCWTEGVGRMHVGGRAKLVCPANIAYGDRGQRTIPPGSTLVFEIELLGIDNTPQPQQPSLQSLLQGMHLNAGDGGGPTVITPGAGGTMGHPGAAPSTGTPPPAAH